MKAKLSHKYFLLVILSITIITIKTDSLDERPPQIDPSNSGVIFLTPENIETEVSNFDYGFVMFTSDDCKHCKAVEPLYHETSNKLRMILNDSNEEVSEKKKQIKNSLKNLGFFMIEGKKHPELMKRYNIDSTPFFIWFNNKKDHYRIYTGETELPKYFFEFAMKQIKYNIEEITLKDLLKFPEEKEFEGQNLILYIGNEKGRNSYYYTQIMQTAFNNDVLNLYRTSDDEIKKRFNIRFKNDINNFDAIMFKIRNKKIDLNQNERFLFSTFDFMQLDRLGKNSNDSYSPLSSEVYSTNFDLNKAYPIKKINDLMQLFTHNPVTEFSHTEEKLIMKGIPTIVMVHDYDIKSEEYRNMLGYFSEISTKYRRDLFFMIATKYSKLTQLFTESFSLKKEDFPALCLTSINSAKKDEQKIDKFRLVANDIKNSIHGENVYSEDNKITLTRRIITTFIDDWKNMNLAAYIPSEELPKEEKDEDNIYKLVAKNFRKILKKNNNKYILVNVCSDRLEICEKFRERLKRVSNKLSNSDRIIVAEFNPYLNEIEEMFDARYIPSLFLIPDKGDRLKDMKIFSGSLSTRDVYNWVINETQLDNFQENKLPLEDTLMMEEDLTDLKAIDLENKSTSRKVYNKLIDPVQKELWIFPEKGDIELEKEYTAEFYKWFFNPKPKKELLGKENEDNQKPNPNSDL